MLYSWGTAFHAPRSLDSLLPMVPWCTPPIVTPPLVLLDLSSLSEASNERAVFFRFVDILTVNE